MPNVGANAGGCWYCGFNEGELRFSCEFDTYVHARCNVVALKKHPDCEEALLIADDILTPEERKTYNV